MDQVTLARWQFAITTVYHFLFVPITIGLSAFVAAYHTAWVRSHKPEHLRMTKWLGSLFTINFALGLVTGIVQEFQFGMNWSDYSRFVGDIFGAPLAFEALLAFFLESTFLGLWIFGWGRIPEKLHAASMWIVHIGTALSAYFILAANSFMQHPVGYRFNPETGRAEMTDFVAVLINKVQLVTFPHVMAAAYMTGAALVLAAALWHLRRPGESADLGMYRRATRSAAIVMLASGALVVGSGDLQGKVMTEVQPMKMAAAEAHYETSSGAPFSVLSTGDLNGENAHHWIEVPGLLSFLGKGDFTAEIEGIDNLREEYAQTYGAGELTADTGSRYTPNIPLAYWTFRLMMGTGFAAMGVGALVLWMTRRSASTSALRQAWWHWLIMATPLLPLLANSFGWIFTETGRQPWAVFGLMTTASAVSPGVSTVEVLVSMSAFTLLYGALAVVEVKLLLRYVRQGAVPVPIPSGPSGTGRPSDQRLVFSY
ncbi:cytochrome ubiquinol oxidase subunit I [Luteococcus sp.]|uniref:cytochrome ubiquinol oxidase subunit I n=1 Tax=Luteococcus sp. TaxID=1969402 RepID=UPI0037356203